MNEQDITQLGLIATNPADFPRHYYVHAPALFQLPRLKAKHVTNTAHVTTLPLALGVPITKARSREAAFITRSQLEGACWTTVPRVLFNPEK